MNARYNWDSSSHQELYDEIHGKGNFFVPDGTGVSGAVGAQDGWAELATLMANARDRTEDALARSGAVWEGDAAYAMRSGVTPLAQWADDAHVAGTASQSSTDSHVGSYAAAKNGMPEPVPVTSTANSDLAGIPAGFTHLFGGQTDQDRQEAAAQEAKAEAVRVMAGYEDESLDAAASVGQFVPPPAVTVNVAPTHPTGGDVIQVGDSAVREPGQSVADSTRSMGDTRGPGAASPPPIGASAPPSPGSTSGAAPPPPIGPSAPPPPGSTSGPQGTAPPPLIGASAPPLSGNVSGPQGTASNAVTTPLSPVGLPSTSLVPDQFRPNQSPVPAVGLGIGSGAGSAERGPAGGRSPAARGFGGGVGEGTARGPGAGGAAPGPGGARGAGPGVGGLPNEAVAGRAGGSSGAGGRGAGGMGMAPVGGSTDRDEDKEHKTAEYLQGTNDSFWDDSPPVAPAVIGDEDDD